MASSLRPGQVVALPRALGRRESRLHPGTGAGTGRHRTGDQPTYTIVNEYTGGRMPLFHFDMYRLSSEEDLFDIGWEATWTGVACAWWSGASGCSALWARPVTVTIEKIPGSDQRRKITIEGYPMES
ncbi:MAG: tRNA (adenosine(37)-N6)-threonylcarbamoyltransferase complex ATPase subunit type 1 TsaE [Oscillospiraceae bacterium]